MISILAHQIRESHFYLLKAEEKALEYGGVMILNRGVSFAATLKLPAKASLGVFEEAILLEDTLYPLWEAAGENEPISLDCVVKFVGSTKQLRVYQEVHLEKLPPTIKTPGILLEGKPDQHLPIYTIKEDWWAIRRKDFRKAKGHKYLVFLSLRLR